MTLPTPVRPAPAPLLDRQRSVLRGLMRLIAERARRGPQIEQEYRQQVTAAEREFEETYRAVIIRFASDKETADRAVRETRVAVAARFETAQTAAAQELALARVRLRAHWKQARSTARQAHRETVWTAAAVLDGERSAAETRLQDVQKRAAVLSEKLRKLEGEALGLLESWGLAAEEVDGELAAADEARDLPRWVAAAEEEVQRLRALVVPRFVRPFRLVAVLLLVELLLLGPAALLAGWVAGPAALTVLVIALGLAARPVLRSMARARVRRCYLPLRSALRDAETARALLIEQQTARKERKEREAKRRHDTDVGRAREQYRRLRAALKQEAAAGLRQAQETFTRRRAEYEARHTADMNAAEERHRTSTAAIQDRYETGAREVHARRDRLRAESRAVYEREARSLAERWRDALSRAGEAVAAVTRENQRVFPAWEDASWEEWTPPDSFPPALRFGSLGVTAELLGSADGLPAPLDDFVLPAACSFPGRSSLLLLTSDAGRGQAVDALRAVMFRLLTVVPPGKVRFTLLDPVGLGESFAAFMHLADYQEALVGSRIWTEAGHIDQRLADLTAHMENVIQKYLRNQFATIEDYNAQAGEVAEPFRYLVVANFPANFSTEAARRLVSIAQSGPRCGVHLLVSVDTKQPMPPGFDLADLEQAAGVTLVWDDGRFTWKDGDFGRFPLTLDEPPPAELVLPVLRIVGERSRAASRVEVPFSFIAPTEESWWRADSRRGLSVPLGRSGATKRQLLELGQGTSQHVLVAGKTGSGKSTLLHALITNLALMYSPDEVELYLIDFKKGVEFKAYAAHELPHARVVAIESEREFGLSVLQRLDAELRERGERFRAVGAQNLAGYREACPGETLPRVLFIVDEFQEFFTEDDRVAQEAAQLLDRLVRQGRAFGLHVLLGSQTLGGAYTLARSTIDQIAVRIALQCSQADAHLILSDDNAAARLLSRPGEAIYNDANGLVEGNNFFQVVWLPDERREAYLDQVRSLALQRRPHGYPAPLIFEGNAPADPGKNPLLEERLAAPAWSAEPRAPRAWLGEALTIKGPTAATFRPQTACNLLVVGQQDEAALALLVLSLMSLATQLSPEAVNGQPRLYVLDGSPVDAPQAGYLARLAEVLPHPLRVAGWRGVPALMGELAAEVERRQQAPDDAFPPVFLFLFGLHRFRDLRRSDDDFSFGRREEKPNPAQQLATLLREGAGLGVHTLLWCDTLGNLQRSLDRQALREFDLRVLFQMSAADSSNLIDSPLAGKLGAHRAYFHSEEQGLLEKFRPYALPGPDWLARVGASLRGRMGEAVPNRAEPRP